MVDIMYWVGFFDGEGSIHISKVGGVRVALTQKRRKVLELAMEQFGGNICDFHGLTTSNWSLSKASESKNFLSLIYPHSIVKKEEIAIGLKAIELLRPKNLGCVPLTPDEMEKRMELRNELQAVRPKKTFSKSLEKMKVEREAIKEQHDHMCSKCGDDLRETSLQYQIVSDGKLFCRRCHGTRYKQDIKPISKERIEEVLAQTETLDEACAILGVNRSSLYVKRMKYGLPKLRPQKF